MTTEELHQHVAEAVRHIHAAMDAASCVLCRQLLDEEAAHLEMADQLMDQAEQLAAVQAEKRGQLSGGPARAEEIRDAGPEQVTRLVAEERSSPGHYRREGFIESLIRTRPRLMDMVPKMGEGSR